MPITDKSHTGKQSGLSPDLHGGNKKTDRSIKTGPVRDDADENNS